MRGENTGPSDPQLGRGENTRGETLNTKARPTRCWELELGKPTRPSGRRALRPPADPHALTGNAPGVRTRIQV